MTFWLIARLIASLVLLQPTSAELCVWPFLQKGSFKTHNQKKSSGKNKKKYLDCNFYCLCRSLVLFFVFHVIYMTLLKAKPLVL